MNENTKNELLRMALSAVVPLFLLGAMYLLKGLETGMEWDFTHLGVYPLSKRGAFGIFAHPLVHSSFRHLLANTFPLLFLSWSLFYFYRGIASTILIVIWIAEGILTFCIGQPGWHVGASGVIYGLAFFLFFSGLLRRYVPLIAISLLVTFLYGGMVWNMFPQFVKPTTSWEGHLSGAVVGTLCAFAFRKEGPQSINPFEGEEEAEGTEEESSGEYFISEQQAEAGEELKVHRSEQQQAGEEKEDLNGNERVGEC